MMDAGIVEKKKLLANILFHRLKWITFPLFKRIKPNNIYVFAYHRVFPDPGPDYVFEKGTISATPEDFEKQLSFIKDRFQVINFNILSNLLSTGEPLQKDCAIITFDDGYSDNYEIAFKILKKNSLTATIFPSTFSIDNGRIFWFDQLTYILKKVPPGRIRFKSGRYIFEVTDINRAEIRDSVMKILRSVTNQERLNLLNQLEQESGITVSESDLELAKPLNWKQIKEMSDEGIEIGSHTVTHPFLTNLTRDEILYEFAESKERIEKETGKQVRSVAYPNGDYNQIVINCAKQCGYKFGISYKHDIVNVNKYNPFAIPRIHVEPDVDLPLFQANILFPQVFVKYGR